MIPYGRQHLDEDDIAEVVAVLRSDWLTQGPYVDAFEAELASVTGAQFAIAFASGTAALHAAAVVSGVHSGSRAVTSPLSFAASAACIRYAGGSPAFLDIDSATWNLDIERLPTGCDVLVAVHYAGLPLDLRRLPYRPSIVIEDAAHALGATTPDGPIGNCARSDFCCFSFHPVKAITTGEGGAVTTNSEDGAEALRRFRNHGIVRRPELGAWYYEIDRPGYNYRITDIQCALGVSQLRKLPSFIARRAYLAERYHAKLSGLPIRMQTLAPPGFRHAYHLFPIWVHHRDAVFTLLRDAGIGVQVHYVPIYRHPAYAADSARFPNSERVYGGLLTLPIHPSLTDEQQDLVIASLCDAL